MQIAVWYEFFKRPLSKQPKFYNARPQFMRTTKSVRYVVVGGNSATVPLRYALYSAHNIRFSIGNHDVPAR